MVHHVSSTLSELGHVAATEKLYPALKNSSDTHPATLPSFPNSRSPVNPVYLWASTLDHRFQSHLEDPLWSQWCGILRWWSTVSACKYLCADSVSRTFPHTAGTAVNLLAGRSILLAQILCTYRTLQCCHPRGLVAVVFKPHIR